MLNQLEVLLPGLYDPGIALLFRDPSDDPKNNAPVGYTGLMAAIISQAKIDALAGDQEAIEWLQSDLCFDCCFALNFNHENVIAWIAKEFIKQ